MCFLHEGLYIYTAYTTAPTMLPVWTAIIILATKRVTFAPREARQAMEAALDPLSFSGAEELSLLPLVLSSKSKTLEMISS